MKKLSIYTLLISIIILGSSQISLSQDKQAVIIPKPTDLNAIEFNKMLDNDSIILIDIRTKQEFDAGHIEGAIMIDWYQRYFETAANKLDKNATVLIYCRSGNRTSKAKYMLIGMGFTDIYNLEFGLNDWLKNGFELVK